MNTIEYENHRRAAVRAYANQFATGQYRVRLTDSDGTYTFAFRNPRTARRFLRRRTRPGSRNACSGTMFSVSLNQQAQEFRNAANFAASMGDHSTMVTVMIADTICH